MSKDKIIENHYTNVAKNFGLSGRCTIQDPIIRTHEISFFKNEIAQFIAKFERNPVVLDLGCGNGYTIEELASYFPNAYFVGLEPHPELLKLAQARDIPNAKFEMGNALNPHYQDFAFDIIITERVLVNLTSDQQQETAFKNIANNLVPGGNYLMIESFVEPLQKLNKIRRENLLGEELKQSDHNLYMKFTLLRKLIKYGLFTQQSDFMDELSPHFFLSRVFHPLTRQEGSKMKENTLIEILENSGSFHQLKGQFLSPIQFMKFAKNS